MSRKKNKNRASKVSKDSMATSMKPPKDLKVTKTKKRRQKGHEFALKTSALDLIEEPIVDENSAHRMQKDGSASAFYKEVSKVIEAADVILEVLDARDPLGTRCKQMEDAVKAYPHKRVVLLLNKADLVPRDNIAKWIKYLRRELPAIAFKASTQNQKKRLGQKGRSVGKSTDSQLTGSSSVGCSTLMSLLTNYCRNKDIKTAIRVGVVGYPNVGKSSIINSLKRSKACNTGSVPGVTRCVQEIQLDKKIKLLDSPGLVLSNSTDDPLKNVLRVETLRDPVAPVERILQRCDTAYMRQKYALASGYRDTTEFLHLLSLSAGRLKKGGIPDAMAAARIVLNDWNCGNIRYFTHPPEKEEEEIGQVEAGAAIVAEFSKEFDLNALDEKMDFDAIGDDDEDGVSEGVAVSTASEDMSIDSSGKQEIHKKEARFDVDKKDLQKSKAEDLSMANVGGGRKSLKKLKRLQTKKDRKDRNRRDRVAVDLSDKLERAFGDM